MSGIFAVLNREGSPVEREFLEKVSRLTDYRGPDGSFVWKSGSTGILQQVMKTTPECTILDWPLIDMEAGLVLAADARIDNRPELIHLLQAKGERLREIPADEELILAAYRVWGNDSPKYLIGDFTYIIWNMRSKSLFCARDALGVKQLYFFVSSQAIILGTEISQILAHPATARELDEKYIGNFLVFNWVEPERTMFAHIQALPAGAFLTANEEETRIVQYWQTEACQDIRYRDDREYSEHFLEIFERAIRDRLRTTKKKIGILMSGGLDSGSVAATIQQIISRRETTPLLKAISITYDPFPLANERDLIQDLEKELHVDVVYIRGEEYWMLRDKEAFTPSLETPEVGAEELNLEINRIFRDLNIQVILGGQGGDHLLTGSPRIYGDRFARGDFAVLTELFRHSTIKQINYPNLVYRYILRPMIPNPWVEFYRKASGKQAKRQFPGWLREDFVRRIDLKDESQFTNINGWNMNLARLETEKQIKAIPFFTRNQDNSSKRAQLEARPPFTDRRLAEFVIGIPQEQHYRAGCWKFLLRESMKGILPEAIRNRKDKATLEPFFHYSLREKEKNQLLDLFKEPILSIIGVIDKSELDKSLAIYLSKKKVNFDYTDWITTNPWHVICLELWLRKFYGIMDH